MQYMASQNALSIPDGNVVVELLVKEASSSLGRRRRDDLVRVLWSPTGHFLKQNIWPKKFKNQNFHTYVFVAGVASDGAWAKKIETDIFYVNKTKTGLRSGRPRMESMGQDSVWAGTFWGFLNVWLCASGAQLGLVIVYLMWVQFRMGSSVLDTAWGNAHFSSQTFFISVCVGGGPIGLLRCLNLYW